jgi:hypothetical protein
VKEVWIHISGEHSMNISKLCSRAIAILLAGVAASSGSIAAATEVVEPTASQKQASELLSAMAGYLAKLPGYKTRMITSYDSVQESGQKIEFNEMRQVTLSRPNLLRVEQMMSDGAQDLLLFDGKNISVFDSDLGVYAQVPQPGSIDDAVVYFVRELGMRLPMSSLLSTRLAEEMSKRVKSIEYVEFTNIFGVGAHHIAAVGNTVDAQFWIMDGERPLPLHIVLTYKTEPGQPQFRAVFRDWDEKSSPAADTFQFKPPADAQRIIFAVQAPPVNGAPASSEAPSGNSP